MSHATGISGRMLAITGVAACSSNYAPLTGVAIYATRRPPVSDSYPAGQWRPKERKRRPAPTAPLPSPGQPSTEVGEGWAVN